MRLSTSILARLRAFAVDDDGSATVDFVIGTALGVTLTIAVMQSISGSVTGLSDKIGEAITGIHFPWEPPPED